MITTFDFPQLDFEEESHTYRLNGHEIPSVTTILKPLSEKYYGGIRKDVLEQAAQRGTAVHQSIELYLKYGILDVEQEHEGYLKGFQQWKEDFSVKTLYTERKIFHKGFLYGGTMDLLCEENGIFTVVDFKTTASLAGVLVGPQLIAYEKALESHGIKPENRVALQLTKEGGYRRYSSETLPPSQNCWQTFLSCLDLHKFYQTYKK